jgi:hypothetical protein
VTWGAAAGGCIEGTERRYVRLGWKAERLLKGTPSANADVASMASWLGEQVNHLTYNHAHERVPPVPLAEQHNVS